MKFRSTGLMWGVNRRGQRTHIEWHSPCGCAFHPDGHQGPHIHPCSEHETLDLAQVVRLKDEIIKGKNRIIACYRLGHLGKANAALTRIERAERKLAELEAS